MSGTDLSVFKRLRWANDRVTLDDLTLRLQHFKTDTWDGGDHLMLYKTKELVDQYERFVSRHAGFHPRHILELGIWDGGSTAFWCELFQPDQLVSVDALTRTDHPYFLNYLASRGLTGRVHTHWGTNQTDDATMRALVDRHFGPERSLDLVIDDASHLYEQTRASFETLFPRLRPGGWFIIEDWAWHHWPDWGAASHPWARLEAPTKLITQLVELCGSTNNRVITELTVYQGFIVVERGPDDLDRPFSLEDRIVRRPARSWRDRLVHWLQG